MDFTSLRYVQLNPYREQFKVTHKYDANSFGYKITLVNGNVECTSDLIMVYGFWNKMLISFYPRLFSTSPWAQSLHFLVYTPVLDADHPYIQMNLKCNLNLVFDSDDA